jgi:hypothetical protein
LYYDTRTKATAVEGPQAFVDAGDTIVPTVARRLLGVRSY